MITFDSHSTDPYYNLAFEEYIFTVFREEDVFLLWRNRPCVVVGSCQNICREVKIWALRQRGIPVLRRISGGGAVYHDPGNVNYSLMTRQEESGADYDRSLAPILAALHAMDVPAGKRRTCDLAIGEEKISGSAQRMAGGRLLHHGTLLFDADLAALEEISVQGKNPCVQTRGTQSAICSVTNIRWHLAEDMTTEEFQRRLLERMVPSPADHLELTEAQRREVCRLAEEKYRSWAWTRWKTHAFSYQRSGIFQGAPIAISYQSKKGILSEVKISSPLLDGDLAASLLNGAQLDPENLEQICRTLAGAEGHELLPLLL